VVVYVYLDKVLVAAEEPLAKVVEVVLVDVMEE
jgi:hypothetical protein